MFLQTVSAKSSEVTGCPWFASDMHVLRSLLLLDHFNLLYFLLYVYYNQLTTFVAVLLCFGGIGDTFYHTALNAGRSSHEKGVRLSVSLPNAWIVTKRKKVCPDFYTIRKII